MWHHLQHHSCFTQLDTPNSSFTDSSPSVLLNLAPQLLIHLIFTGSLDIIFDVRASQQLWPLQQQCTGFSSSRVETVQLTAAAELRCFTASQSRNLSTALGHLELCRGTTVNSFTVTKPLLRCTWTTWRGDCQDCHHSRNLLNCTWTA